MISQIFNDIPLVLELIMAVLLIWVIFKKSSNHRDIQSLSIEKVEQIFSKWTPEPLVSDVPKLHRSLNSIVLSSQLGKYIEVNGFRCLNLATHDYLGMGHNNEVQLNAIRSIKKYGVGSCGPRGFYGTVDVHLELEEKIAKFMGMEEAVVYSYGFSAIASAIPAYAKRADIIFVDENVNFAIQKGLDASRSEVRVFKHNDMEHLEMLLVEQNMIDLQNLKKAEKTRRFLVVEGIYINSGDICPLPQLIELRKKYKLRIFIDESLSFGILGNTGRGVTEHFNIPIIEVDLIIGNLEWSLGSVGGFCVGSSFIVEHQRLSGLGYCFSASLPPLLTTAAIIALEILGKKPELPCNLQAISCFCHSYFESSNIMKKLYLQGDPVSPIKHLRLENSSISFEEQNKMLQHVVDCCIEQGIALTIAAHLTGMDKNPSSPSIRIIVNSFVTEEDISIAVRIIESTLDKIFI